MLWDDKGKKPKSAFKTNSKKEKLRPPKPFLIALTSVMLQLPSDMNSALTIFF